MSSQKGNVRKKAPAHQNKVAFRHNPKSQKTNKILNLPNEGLCSHCHELIEWKKKYRKYKPLTVPRKCSDCSNKTITRAYHIICQQCASNSGVCAKCKVGRDIVKKMKTPEEIRERENKLKEKLAMLTERERRTFIRRITRDPQLEEQYVTNLIDGTLSFFDNKDDNEDNDESESDDENEDEKDEEEEEKEDMNHVKDKKDKKDGKEKDTKEIKEIKEIKEGKEGKDNGITTSAIAVDKTLATHKSEESEGIEEDDEAEEEEGDEDEDEDGEEEEGEEEVEDFEEKDKKK